MIKMKRSRVKIVYVQLKHVSYQKLEILWRQAQARVLGLYSY